MMFTQLGMSREAPTIDFKKLYQAQVTFVLITTMTYRQKRPQIDLKMTNCQEDQSDRD